MFQLYPTDFSSFIAFDANNQNVMVCGQWQKRPAYAIYEHKLGQITGLADRSQNISAEPTAAILTPAGDLLTAENGNLGDVWCYTRSQGFSHCASKHFSADSRIHILACSEKSEYIAVGTGRVTTIVDFNDEDSLFVVNNPSDPKSIAFIGDDSLVTGCEQAIKTWQVKHKPGLLLNSLPTPKTKSAKLSGLSLAQNGSNFLCTRATSPGLYPIHTVFTGKNDGTKTKTGTRQDTIGTIAVSPQGNRFAYTNRRDIFVTNFPMNKWEHCTPWSSDNKNDLVAMLAFADERTIFFLMTSGKIGAFKYIL